MRKEGRWRPWPACEEFMPPLHSLVCPLYKRAHPFLTGGRVERQKEEGQVAEGKGYRRDSLQACVPAWAPLTGTVLCVVRCVAASLVCTSETPAAAPPELRQPQTTLHTARCPLGGAVTPVETHCLSPPRPWMVSP